MKQLLIIIYKLQVAGLTRDQVDDYFGSFQKAYSLREDEELKENYIIREVFLPLSDGRSDIKVIYPQPNYISPEINKLVNEITEKIKEDPTNTLSIQWTRLVRELKLRKLKNYDQES
jgi:hypothetical protein